MSGLNERERALVKLAAYMAGHDALHVGACRSLECNAPAHNPETIGGMMERTLHQVELHSMAGQVGHMIETYERDPDEGMER